MEYIYEKSILLIGGMSIGKTTISELLGKELKLPILSTDAIKDEILMKDIDYSFGKQLKIRNEKGFEAESKFLIPYLNKTLINILDNLDRQSIIDIGALNTLDLDEELINKITQFKFIVYLKSSNNLSILERRNIDSTSEVGQIYLKTLNNPNNDKLATIIINIDGKIPYEITREIITLIYNNSISK